MKPSARTLLVVLLLGAAAVPARACGFGEAPGGCGGESAENEAKWMLKRVVAAIDADKPKALGEFARGEAGFRTVDSYVFCVGPDGVMSAHPSPLLQGQDVHDLHDQTGNYFIATMLKTAQPGKVLEIRYMFPRPGSTVAIPKTTFYTKAADQVCGVGVYDGTEQAPAAMAPAQRMKQLRDRLNAAMPANLSDDWAAYTQLLDSRLAADDAAFAQARQRIEAAGAALSPGLGQSAMR